MGVIITPEQAATVNIVTQVAASLSICGSLFVLIACLRFPLLRKFPFVLVPVLALTDVLTMISTVCGPSPDDMAAMALDPTHITSQCQVQGAAISFFRIATVLWTACIAFVMYSAVVLNWQYRDREWLAVALSVLVCYGTAAAVSGVGWHQGVYGPAGAWCWVADAQSSWRYIGLYAWVWVAMLINLVIAISMRIQGLALIARKQALNGSDTLTDELQVRMRRVSFYPLVFLLVWFFPSVNRIHEAVTGDQVYGLYLLHAFFSGLQGLCDAIVYGWAAREAVFAVLPPSLKCCCRNERPEFTTESVNPLVAIRRRFSAADGVPRPKSSVREWSGIALVSTRELSSTSSATPTDEGRGGRLSGVEAAFGDDDDDVNVSIPVAHAMHAATSGSMRQQGAVMTTVAPEGRSRLSLLARNSTTWLAASTLRRSILPETSARRSASAVQAPAPISSSAAVTLQTEQSDAAIGLRPSPRASIK